MVVVDALTRMVVPRRLADVERRRVDLTGGDGSGGGVAKKKFLRRGGGVLDLQVARRIVAQRSVLAALTFRFRVLAAGVAFGAVVRALAVGAVGAVAAAAQRSFDDALHLTHEGGGRANAGSRLEIVQRLSLDGRRPARSVRFTTPAIFHDSCDVNNIALFRLIRISAKSAQIW